MTQRQYSPEQKAEAIKRMLAGESASAVARDMGIARTTILGWQDAVLPTPDATAATVILARTRTRAEVLNERLADLLDAELVTLRRHMEHYGSEEWITKQTPSVLLESTRTVGRALIAALDRMAGGSARAATGADSDDSTD